MTKRAYAALIATLALAACGGGGGESSSEGSSKSEPMSATSLAGKVGCTDYTSDSEEMYVKEGGTCTTSDGESVQIATFSDAKAQDDYMKVATSFGGTWVTGDLWAVSTDSAKAAGKVASATGGTVKK